MPVADRRHQCRGAKRPDAGNLEQPLAALVLLAQPADLTIVAVNALSEAFETLELLGHHRLQLLR